MKRQYIQPPIIVIGAGLTGSYIARKLADLDYKVTIIEKRSTIAGNLYDKIDEQTGCLFQCYGPHIFHTDEDWIYKWINKYSEITNYTLKTQVFFKENNKYFTCPFNLLTVKDLFLENRDIITALNEEFPRRETVSILELINSKNKEIKKLAKVLWTNDYLPYTCKQWGLKPEEVDPSILARVPFHLNYSATINNSKYELVPTKGFTELFKNLLNHKNIEIKLNEDGLSHLSLHGNKILYDNKELPIIYTGPIDELFNFEFGELPYRSLSFSYFRSKHEYTKDGNPCVDIYPSSELAYTRISHYGKLPIQNNLQEEILGIEIPSQYNRNSKLERFYPVQTDTSKIIYTKYLELANSIDNLYLSGRLADFKYYDMDKALIRAEEVFQKLIKEL